MLHLNSQKEKKGKKTEYFLGLTRNKLLEICS